MTLAMEAAKGRKVKMGMERGVKMDCNQERLAKRLPYLCMVSLM